MILITLKWPGHKEDSLRRAINMSAWLKERGLKHGIDYDWGHMTARKETHFRFYGDNESTASMFALAFMGKENEVV